MAYDLHTGFQRLRAISDDYAPTSPTDTTLSRDNDTKGTRTPAKEAGSESAGGIDSLGFSAPALSSRVSDTDLEWLARSHDATHATTQPIDVPQSPGVHDTERGPDKELEHDSQYQATSLLDEFMRNRRPSISFHPQVTLDSGRHRPLEEPLPKLEIDTKARSRPILPELGSIPVFSPLLRSNSEAGSRHYDAVTAELLDSKSPHHQSSTTACPPKEPSHYPLLLSTVNGANSDKGPTDSEREASLTSESTTSPVISEIQTPKEGMDILVSPISSFPSFPYPISLEDSSAWPKPRRQASASRAKSFTPERKPSMRQVQRRSSRRSTASSISPATAFLSRFAKEEVAPEQDSEGQEVGEYVLGKQVGFGGFSTVREAYTIEGDERICRAVKIVRRQLAGREEAENEQLQAEFEHEVRLWRCLGHRNILPLIEVYETHFATFCFTKLNTGGTLFDLVRANRRGIGRDLTRRYAYQLASAIRYLHEDVRVIHRDIKLENCLIDVSDPDAARDGGSLLLCDFGLAEFATNDIRRNSADLYERATDRPTSKNTGSSETSTSVAGSLQYASPELIMSPAGFLSSVVDIWAYGVVIYAMLVGDLPFQHVFQPRVRMKILAGEWDMAALEKAAGGFGDEEEALELVAGCLEMHSDHRWTIADVLKSRWLEGCQEMLEELSESWRL
ncbi:hypothetical protein MMC28_004835 [Mycoblastus sanguinarius]|nr:hypothetical protein [Mycoblastus sanguinarius]